MSRREAGEAEWRRSLAALRAVEMRVRALEAAAPRALGRRTWRG